MKYLLITAARNEELYIENCIRSVLLQTVKPVRWVIVSDGSTDRTDEIVKGYAESHSWIVPLRMPGHKDRQFASQVHCFNAGYQEVKHIPFDIIGNLDADVSFEADFFAYLLAKFSSDAGLGVAGTSFIERGSVAYNYAFTNIEHVSGMCQLFRRKCFEAVDGFTPIEIGGHDFIAVTKARMLGWRTRTFTDKNLIHHRPAGGAESRVFRMLIQRGRKDYLMGNHVVFEFARATYQIGKRPYIGGFVVLLGYLHAFARRLRKPVSADLVTYYRQEQMRRLRYFIFDLLGLT
jgi:biofilm PGA synthesis N-glycosyltransferase PgaC